MRRHVETESFGSCTAGCMLSSTNPDDLHYKAFAKIVPHFTRENLQLYIYNSPYVHGLGENEPLKQVIRDLGLTNIHACKPLELDEFVKAISGYDFGATFISAQGHGRAGL